jgi:heme-degrading monooxygenase HmoA
MRIERPGVVEHAVLTVNAGAQSEFEAALERGYDVLARSDGFQWAQALHEIEDPSTYVLLIGWDSVESHTQDFAGSDLFGEWRAVIGPYLARRATVTHAAVGPRR